MKSDLLINYIFEHLNAVENYLRAYSKDGESERLHLLRIEIKKIKAVFSFFKHIHREIYNSQLLNSLFHKAGVVRETEIYLLLLVTLTHVPEKFILQLEKEKKKRKEEFDKKIKGYIRGVIRIRKKTRFPEAAIHTRLIKKYVKAEMQKVYKAIANPDRKNMHRMRMRLKKIMFLYEALPEKIQAGLKLNTDYINKLQKKAGDWHDTYTTIDFLSRRQSTGKLAASVSELEEKEKKLFRGIIKKIKEPRFLSKPEL